ncbi:hypothetical protein Clacol_001727 [Clathrus columnatus]|uniref:Uncharacterized protein n=1 Tax=Clathrus columnatus TaxID=1419009 RepID=A0AAV5A6I8_9AGAM|nr:hypothetical protein Clacol_001727 [Clathrus columnatus]
MKEVVVKAEYFRRKFYLFGPPEWRDPAIIVLSGITPSHGVSVYPSIFPFVAPHIMISPPSEEEEQNNSLNYQNHDHGNRLVVCLASPRDCFSVLNADESRYPLNLMMMSLRETIVGKAQAPPGCLSISPSVSKEEHKPEPPCLESDDEYSHIPGPEPEPTQIEINEKQQVDAGGNVNQTLKDNFWLEEDDTELPDLPEDW